jgi:DNA-directed RNA polymerase sigma subunit (sigma70/sigma32)
VLPETANINERLEELLTDIFPPGSVYARPVRLNDAVAFAIWQDIGTLPPNERNCICLHYGITKQPARLTEIAKSLKQDGMINKDATREQIRRLLARGLNKLRQADGIRAALGPS